MIRKTLFLTAALAFTLPLACDGDDDSDTDTGAGTGADGIPAEYAGATNPVEGDSAAIAAGMSTYMTACATCHGDTGAGDGPASMSDPPPTDFTTVTGQADDYMLWKISDGVAGTTMAGYSGSLSEDQIWEVTAFIRTL